MNKLQPEISEREFKETMIVHVRDTFNNDFSDSIYPQIYRIKEEIRLCREEAQKFESKLTDFRSSDKREPNEEESELLMDQAEFQYDAFIWEEKLKALSEMKIIFLFKTLEISLKKLTEIAFPEEDAEKLFRWEDIKNCFKAHDIYLSEFEEYDSAIQLKHVSNNLKHSDRIEEKVNQINEFKSESIFKFENLESFYSRIENDINSFVTSLSSKLIYDINSGT